MCVCVCVFYTADGVEVIFLIRSHQYPVRYLVLPSAEIRLCGQLNWKQIVHVHVYLYVSVNVCVCVCIRVTISQKLMQFNSGQQRRTTKNLLFPNYTTNTGCITHNAQPKRITQKRWPIGRLSWWTEPSFYWTNDSHLHAQACDERKHNNWLLHLMRKHKCRLKPQCFVRPARQGSFFCSETREVLFPTANNLVELLRIYQVTVKLCYSNPTSTSERTWRTSL